MRVGLCSASFLLVSTAGCVAPMTAPQPLAHDVFLARLKNEMSLAELRAASRGIPYRRYHELGAGPTLKWTQFTYYFPGRRTVIARATSGFDEAGKGVPDRGQVWYFSSSTDPQKADYGMDLSGNRRLLDVHPSYFMLDLTPDRIGGNEVLWDER